MIFSVNFGGYVFAINQKPANVYVTLETPLYQSPNITAPLIKENESTFYVPTGTVLTVVQDYTDSTNTFYKVNIYNIVPSTNETDTAYILIAHTIDLKVKSPQKKLDVNATVKNDNSKIYRLNPETNQFEEIGLTLNKDTKIRILDNGYEKNKEYTHISFYSNDQEILSYYIKTADIYAKGISYTIVAACLTLFACVSIILVLLGIKSKKKRKK